MRDGVIYRPWVLDDSGKTQGFRMFLCQLCHCYYADPETEGMFHPGYGQKHPKVQPRNICAARLAALFIPAADTEMPL
jgi:hypothetical protein